MKYLAVFLIFLFFSCVNKEKEIIINTTTESGTIGSIDIPSPGFFFMLRPWKEGTLITMDGRARFAELSFTGDSGIRISPLVDFPKQRIDRIFAAMPESDICLTASAGIFHVADIAAQKTKTFAPFPMWSWRWGDTWPMLLDPGNGIICFLYSLTSDARRREPDYLYSYNIIYDAKNDTVLYESPQKGESVAILFAFTPELTWCQYWIDGDTSERILYNWKTREIIRNDLTETLKRLNLSPPLEHGLNINVKERYMFAYMRKITWDENFEDIKIIPLNYLFPPEKGSAYFYLSADGKWATAFVSGYRGLYDEFLYKRAFFHLDERYPNGISMPIFADDYYASNWGGGGSFVEHPVYGMCYAAEHHDISSGENELYLRLHKMDDVLEEINRQLLEQ